MSAVQRRDPAAAQVALVTGASSGIGRATAARLADAGQVVFAAARHAPALESLAQEHPNFVLPGTGLYSASKFAVEAYSDALPMELAPYGILVVLVEPGVSDTSLYEPASASLSGYTQALEPYCSTWAGGFEFPQRLLKSAATVDSVTADVVKAALATNPRPRYRPGIRNRMRTRLLTTLPTRMADRIKQRLAGDCPQRRNRSHRRRPAGGSQERTAPLAEIRCTPPRG
jgi:NAD(P)-dependent dehydrogenase (short-subunit alcohol dehydrogenase family)